MKAKAETKTDSQDAMMGCLSGSRKTGSITLDQHLVHFSTIDWSSTSLGPIDSWSQDLLQLGHIMMFEPQPRMLLLGQDHYCLYNPAFATLIGDGHPSLLGSTWTHGWSDVIRQRDTEKIEKSWSTGAMFHSINDCPATFYYHGQPQETSLNWTFTALTGMVTGFFVSCEQGPDVHISKKRRISLQSEHAGPLARLSLSNIGAFSHEPEASIDQQSNIDLNGDVHERLVKMQKIIDGVTVGIAEYCSKGYLIHANDAYYRLTSIPKDRTEGLEEFVHPDSARDSVTAWENIQKGVPVSLEMQWKAPVNEYKEDFNWVQAAMEPLIDESGTITSYFAWIIDISAQKRLETESLALHNRFINFADNSMVAIYISNENQEIVYGNDMLFKHLGIPRVEPKEIDWMQCIHEEDHENIWMKRHDVKQGKRFQIQFRTKTMWDAGGGQTFPTWLEATGVPEMNEDGTLKQIIGTMTEISAFKWIEAVQAARVEEAVEARRQQESFIDMTSHEIRNPLSAVVHCADSIAESLSEVRTLVDTIIASSPDRSAGQLIPHIENNLEAARTILSCTSHQKNIVDDILVLSKLNSNLLQISPSCTSPVLILKGLEKMFGIEAQREAIEFSTSADKSLEKTTELLLDHGRLNQILINLVTNALKFVKSRKTRVVTVRTGLSDGRPSKDAFGPGMELTQVPAKQDTIYETPEFADSEIYLWFTVQDSGIGMTSEEKSKVFSRFAQGSRRTHSEYGGSGLGLYISSTLAGMQCGEIGVASESGVGSTFAFFVKTSRCKDPLSSLAKDIDRTRNNTLNSTTTHTTPAHRLGVLIVEDNILNQRVLKKQLEKTYNVYTADNGQEALDLMRTTQHWRINNQQTSSPAHQVDVLLLDIEMPVLNGLDCARMIRRYEEQGDIIGHVPIIAVSANARSEQTDEAIAAGMDDAIAKPFRVHDLIPKIEALVSRGKER